MQNNKKSNLISSTKLFSRKALSLMLTLVMLMSCWVFTPSITADAVDIVDGYEVEVGIKSRGGNYDFYPDDIYIKATFADGSYKTIYLADSYSNYTCSFTNDANTAAGLIPGGYGVEVFYTSTSSYTATFTGTFDKFPTSVQFGVTNDGANGTGYTITSVKIGGISVVDISSQDPILPDVYGYNDGYANGGREMHWYSTYCDNWASYTIDSSHYPTVEGIQYVNDSNDEIASSSATTYSTTITPPAATGASDTHQLMTYYFYDQYGVILKESAEAVTITPTISRDGVTWTSTRNSTTGYITTSVTVNNSAQVATSDSSKSNASEATARISNRTGATSGGYSLFFILNLTDNNYTFTYNDNGGTGGTGSQTANWDTTASFAEPTREHYTFNGYFENADGSGTQLTTSTTIKENKTWYASWIPENYNVYINTNNGDAATTQSVEYLSSVTDITSPTKAEDEQYTYQFSGWKINEDTKLYTTAELLAYPITSYTIVEAQYVETQVAYTVTWQYEDGTVWKTETVGAGDTLTKPENPTAPVKDGYSYSFVGWQYEGESGYLNTTKAVTGPVTLVAVFTETKNEYTITLNDVNGKSYSIEAYYGDSIADKIATALNGIEPAQDATAEFTYEFAGWVYGENDTALNDDDTVENNITLTPAFDSKTNQYTITLECEDDEQLNTETTTYTANYGTDIATLLASVEPTKTSTDGETYAFAGWKNATTGESIATGATLQANMTLAPVFTSTTVQYTVTVQSETGTELGSYTVDYNTTVSSVWTIADQTKASDVTNDYPFDKWVILDENGNETSTEFNKDTTLITSDITIKATFKTVPIEYTITWLNADGTTEFASQSYGYGETIVAPTTTPTKAQTAEFEYEFKEWVYTDEDGKVFADTDTVTGNLKLSPTYTPITREYTITLSGVIDEDTGKDTEITAVYGTTISSLLTSIEPTKEETAQYKYEFDSWVYGDDDTDLGELKVTGDITITPTFDSITKSYTITLECETDEQLGTSTTTYTAKYGTTISSLLTGIEPTKEETAQYEYTFKSWVYGDNDITLGDKTVDGDITISPTFTATTREYTITLSGVADGESADTEITAKYGESISDAIKNITPTKESTIDETYTFDSWVYGEDETNLANETVEGNITLTPTFTPAAREYTITLSGVIDEDTGKDTEITAVYGTTISEAIASITPTQAETDEFTYTFDEWVYDENTELESDKTVTGDITLTPTFDSITKLYTITLSGVADEDGNENTTITAEYGTTISKAIADIIPTKANEGYVYYAFSGWIYENGSEFDDEDTLESNVTLVPVFTSAIDTCTITVLSEDGTETLGTITVADGTVLSNVDFDGIDLDKDDGGYNTYDFDKWLDSEGNEVVDTTTITEDISIKPSYTSAKIEYIITWLDGDGETFATQTYGYNETITAPTGTPLKTATTSETYVFTGWASYDSTVTANMEIQAEFSTSATTYTVTVYDEYGVYVGEYTVGYGSTLSGVGFNVDTTKISDGYNSYTFDKWVDQNGDEVTASTKITGDLTIKATYTATPIVYTVKWLAADEETVLETNNYGYMQTIIEPTFVPTKATANGIQYTFSHWEYKGTTTKFKETDVVTGNVELVPIFNSSTYEGETYTVTFYDEDGVSVLYSLEFIEGTILTQTQVDELGIPTKAGDNTSTWVFTKWTDLDGNNISLPYGVVSDISLKANFERAEDVIYTVTFLDYDGTVLYSDEYGFNDYLYDYSIPTVESRQIGEAYYTFTGWKETTTGYTTIPERITYELTFVAQYTVVGNTYEVSFLDYDGSEILVFPYVPTGATVQYTGTTPERAADTYNCYTFLGWYDSENGGNEVTSFANVTSDITVYARYTSTEHNFTTTISKVATCTENGGTYSYCEHCGYERVVVTSQATGHAYTLINSTDLGNNTYEYTYLCKTCGDYYITQYTEQQATAVELSLGYDDTAHTAINLAKIVLYDSNNTQMMYTYTDAEGAATVYIMTAGTYTLYITGSTFKDAFGTITMDEDGNVTVEIDEIEMNSCSCTCHADSFWASIFRFFHNIFKIFTGGEIKCCGCPDARYYE